MHLNARIDALETALLDYIQRYGLTDAARNAMLPPAVEPCGPPKLVWTRGEDSAALQLSAAQPR